MFALILIKASVLELGFEKLLNLLFKLLWSELFLIGESDVVRWFVLDLLAHFSMKRKEMSWSRVQG